MEWQGHALLGLRAAEGLPEWELSMLKPDMSPQGIGQPFMPPITNVAEKLGAFCLILDWIYQPEFAPYARQADGSWVPHHPVTAGGTVSETGNNALIADMLQKMIDELRAGRWEEAVRRAGALGHFLQEPFTPGHSTPNALFEEIFPDPNPLRHWRLHYCFDSASGDFPPPVPELMGTTAKEAAFRIFNFVKQGIRSGRALIGPVVMAAYRGKTIGENAHVYKALLRRQSEMSSFITCCAWHTAFCIAFDRFDENEAERLRSFDLVSAEPYYMHPSKYLHIVPDKLADEEGRLLPIDVWDENGSEVRFGHGFGMFGHSGYKYFINGNFSRLRFKLGMPSRIVKLQNEHTDLRFSVEVAKGENTSTSEDIEYGADARVLEVRLRAGEPVREYDVDISGADTLILSSRSIPWTTERGEVRYATADLAVIDPVLIR